jgi:putative membrane protein insertion efficiency factor
MGHRHTPEEHRSACGVCSAGGGSVADAQERLALDSAEVQHSAGVRVALFALRFYKAYLSLLFAGSCRFEPTCSRFAYEAIEKFGLGRGIWLGLKRLLRCHPLSRNFGYDPVPEKWEFMPSKFTASAVSRSEVISKEVRL